MSNCLMNCHMHVVCFLVGRLFCTVGLHPTRCKEFEESVDPEGHCQALVSLAKEGVQKGKVVAVGECGLDYDRLQFCPFDLQRKFTAGVAHSFTGSAADRDKLLSSDNLFIGINGCSLKMAENLEVFRGIPVERMMIETDSPYCDIRNTHAGMQFVKSVWSSKRKEKYDHDSTVKGCNEPCFVRQVLEVDVKELMIDQLSKALYHNTCRVFFPCDLDTVADAMLERGIGIQCPEFDT